MALDFDAAPRKMFHAVRRRLHSRSSGTPRVWFVAEYQLPSAGLAEPPLAADFPRLIFHHQLDPAGDGACFVSYWESREDFEASQAPLERHLGDAPLQRAAWVRRMSVERKPLWKRVTAYGVLVHIVAILGALSALEDYQAWLFEKPMIALDLELSEPINVISGSPLETSLLLTNQRANASARVSGLNAQLSRSRQSDSIPLERSHFLAKAGILKLPIRTRALTDTGPYRLVVAGRGRSGLLWGSKPLTLKRVVNVWSQRPQIKLSLVPDSNNSSRAELKGLLHVGGEAPAGLDCLVTLKEPSLRIGPMEFRGMGSPPEPIISWDGLVSTQSWTTPPLPGFSNRDFSLYIEGQPANEWVQVLENIEAECHMRTRGAKS